MRKTNMLLLFALLLVALGCGGGGAASGGGGTAGSGALFMTDSLDSHDHVWITVKKVVLTGATGSVTVFDDSVGKTIDLKTLRDNSGERYSFLGSVPAGAYSSVAVTVDKAATLYSAGSATGVVRDFAGNNGTTATLTLALPAAQQIDATAGFALDFNLGGWSDDGSVITGAPFLRHGQGNGLHDGARHEHDDIHGTIQGLTGTSPDQTFTLIRGGRNVTVVTNAQTVVFNSSGSTSPLLANGKRIELRGAFSTALNAVVADSIKIEDRAGNHEGEAEVRGPVTGIDANAGTFAVTVRRAHHFTPASTTVNVVTGGTTVFVSHGGITLTKAEFFAALASSQEVEAEGTYDSGTNTLTATKVKLEDSSGGSGSGSGGSGGGGGGGGHHESEIKGPVSNINGGAGTFDATALQWQGMSLGSNRLIHIVTTSSTSFERGNMNSTQFFAALGNGQFVEVEGVFDASTSTLTAAKVHFED